MRLSARTKLLGLMAVLIVLLLLSVLLTYVIRMRREFSTTPCMRHLHQLGIAILLYANEHGGSVPDSFATILRTQDVTPDIFICQEDDATPAKDAASFNDGPAHCSFIYVGDRMPMPLKDVPADAVIAFDREDNHEGDGVNILFGDGRTFFLSFAPRGRPPAEWLAVRDQIARGVRPVMLPPAATQPAR